MRRRTFIKTTGLGAAVLVAGAPSFAAEEKRTSAAVLPVGNAPAPVPLPHFPSRVHAFVWRNWPLVPAERLAETINAEPKQIEELAHALGLPDQRRISEQQWRRSHIAIIKRNWHLLPYEQLLILLGWTAEKMAYMLREDDFLFVKLGHHKPKCEPLRWVSRTDAIRAREKEITDLTAQHFGDTTRTRQPLFQFVEGLSEPVWFPKIPKSNGALRLCYSYFALYGDPLLEPGLEPYPDGYLSRLAERGVNAVWLQGVLHKLAPFPWERSLSEGYDQRIQNLRHLVARAKKRGVAIYLYLNEPRSLPRQFFEAHPQLKGVVEGDHAALCTSIPEVQRWMRDAVAQICAAVPGLGGFFTITASENLTNCWSHGAGASCSRCREEGAAKVIAKVNRLVQEGIERAQSRRKESTHSPHLLAWDWGWDDSWAPDVIRQLPERCALMSVSEWSLPIERGGVKTSVGEYSISSIGPGPRARKHWELARQRGLKVVAKIQANNSWELSAVPYIPALHNVAQHAANLRAAGVEDVMLGWTLGGYPSPNLETVQALLQRNATNSPTEALRRIARRRFGAHAEAVLEAWQQFSAAFSEFPYHGELVYSAPLQVGPANLLFEKASGYRASMVGFPYDDLTAWRAIYPADVFIGQFEKVANGFAAGVSTLERHLPARGGSKHSEALRSEVRIAHAAQLHFRSVANQARFIVARNALAKVSTLAEAEPHLAAMERLLRDEIAAARKLHSIQSADTRIGFEATNHYYYVPQDLAEKVLNCCDLLDRWLPAQRARFRAA